MIDLAGLLEPVSTATPSGEDLSFSTEFDAILEARRSDDATLDQGEWVTDLKTADWPAVARRCGDLLRSRSKDLRLAGWMSEALVHTEGFAGLAAGYDLVGGLCDRFWDTVHPAIEAGDVELRVGNLRWLLTQSIDWIGHIPLTDAPQARYDATTIAAAARGHHTEGDTTFPDTARVDAARNATPYAFYQRLAEQVPLAQAALARLEAVINARMGQDGPSFAAARDALDNVGATALRMAAAAGATPGDLPVAQVADSGATAIAMATPAPRTPGEITSRQEAIQQLRRVADFFRRTEPHSPVAYLADKAARWGGMPLHVWLKTVLKDNPALAQLEDMLDVGKEDPDRG